MRSALAIAIVLILVAASLGTGYEFGNATSHTETTTSTATATVTATSSASAAWTVIVQNGTFTGPGCRPATQSLEVFMALRIPCLGYTNSTTWYASLLKYNSKYFYAASETVESPSFSTTYTVWFDNSTAYCVSPYLSVSELPSCPPP